MNHITENRIAYSCRGCDDNPVIKIERDDVRVRRRRAADRVVGGINVNAIGGIRMSNRTCRIGAEVVESEPPFNYSSVPFI